MINFQFCTKPKRCTLFLIYSFLKVKSKDLADFILMKRADGTLKHVFVTSDDEEFIEACVTKKVNMSEIISPEFGKVG